MSTDTRDTLDVSHRLPGWQKRYLYLVDEELSQPFSWANASCVNLMSAAILACHGPKHPALKAIPRYSTDEGAKKALLKVGGLEKFLDEHFDVVPTSHAFQADLVLLKHEQQNEMAGAVMLDGRIVGKHPDTGSPKRIAFYMPIEVAYKVYRV